MVRAEFVGMLESGRRQHFRECLESVAVKIMDPLGLVGHDERALADLVLRRHPGGTALRLDAADGEHEASGAVHPIGTDCKYARHVESADDLAAGAETNLVAQIDADERVVNEKQSLAQRRAKMIRELYRRCPGTALLAVDHDEIRQYAGFQHRLHNRHELP